MQLSGLEKKDYFLLRVEHYLELEAFGQTDSFSVKYVFPPEYGYQVPIVLELCNDTSANIINYRIEKDIYEPNRIVNFTLSSMQEGQHVLLHFTIWVLVEDHDFSDIPEDTNMPQSRNDIPEDTWHWLSSSEMVQSKRIRIRTSANKLEGQHDNVLSYAQNVSNFILKHRYALFLLQLWTRTFFKQDALTTLRLNGENVGRSHLACALFRNKNIPARVILANNDQGFWTQMHYMVEYYHPTYGWVLLDSTKGETPYPTHTQIINRICSIDDEEDTKTDYIYRFMKGEERWIWIDTDQVRPYYVDCDQGSKSQMFTEAEMELSSFAGDYTFFRTQNVYAQYEKFLGADLSISNKNHVNNAITFQKQACYQLIQTQDIDEYIFFIEKAYDEYKAIEL
jgi:transglutaminase-like putative cysteine protease